jgi:hypothetical protein
LISLVTVITQLTSKKWHNCTGSMLLLGAFVKLRKVTIRFIMSVRPSTFHSSAPNGWIFMKFNTWVFLKNLSQKFVFHLNLTRMIDTLQEVQYTFLITSHSVPKLRKVTDKSCRENQNTHFMFNNFFPLENLAVYEIMY